jgi:hypothetical protein
MGYAPVYPVRTVLVGAAQLPEKSFGGTPVPLSKLVLEVMIAGTDLLSLNERRGSSPGPLRVPGWMNLLVLCTTLRLLWALPSHRVSLLLRRAAIEALLILLIMVALRIGTVMLTVVTPVAEKEGI